jgi:hypothetical protein
MARTSRKRGSRTSSGSTVTAPAPEPEQPILGPDGEGASGESISKSERRNMEVRAQLEPLAEGERPPAVTIAAVIAFVLGLSNIVLMLAGYKVKNAGGGATPGGAVLFGAILFLAAWGLWNKRYWAVLGFQVLLGLIVVIAALSLLVASAWEGALLCVAIVGLGGWLFWKLIRAMARIQMPKYRA